MDTITVAIPFPGFYDSLLSDRLDLSYEYLTTDEDGNPDPELEFEVDWKATHIEAAKDYAYAWLRHYGIEGEFSYMTSPRFYNYSTDEAYVEFKVSTLLDLLSQYKDEVYNDDRISYFEKWVTDNYSTRDGFISFIPPFADWPKPQEWDENQWCLFLKYLEADESLEFTLLDRLDFDLVEAQNDPQSERQTA